MKLFLSTIIIQLVVFWSLVTEAVKIQADVHNDETCFSEVNLKAFQSKIDHALNSIIVPQLYGLYEGFPADSCADIYRGHPSGYYWLNVGDQPQQVYCSVNENRCCNGSDGNWMRIAYLNMSDLSQQCPHGWREIDSPIRTCRRQFETSINSVNYSSHGIPYSRVCGRIIAYQYGTPEAFGGSVGFDDAYVDGVSVTYGQNPRHHIWTFAAARGTSVHSTCRCNNPGSVTAVPSFVNSDYFCERGILDADPNPAFVEGNPLWDGHGCTDSSTCCQFNNPPWFCKELPEPTTEDIEIRQMSSVGEGFSLEDEDTPVEFIEVYVQ